MYLKPVELQPAQEYEMRDAFELFIPKNETTIKPKEMVKVFEKLGYNETAKTIYNCVKSMDTGENNDQGLEFRDFLDKAQEYFNERKTEEQMWRIWLLYDKEGKGSITKSEMQ